MTNKHEKMIKLTSKRNENYNHNEIGQKKIKSDIIVIVMRIHSNELNSLEWIKIVAITLVGLSYKVEVPTLISSKFYS